jgi:uncharacterized membrane protein
MVSEAAALGAVLVMVVVTFATRIAGVWVMSHFAITPRIEAFLKSMGTSVPIAIVVPSTVAGTPRLWLAVAAAAIVMAATRNSLIAMTVGTVAAGLARSVSG